MENNQLAMNFGTKGKEKIVNHDHGLKETKQKNGQDGVATLPNKHLVEGTDPPAPPRSKPVLYYWTIGGVSKLRWTPELHDCFFKAIKELGGPFSATPQDILMKMDIDGLTFEDIRSHFLKYITITEQRKAISDVMKESLIAAQELLGHDGPSASESENWKMDESMKKLSEICQLVEHISRLEEQPAAKKTKIEEKSAGKGDA